MGYTKLSAKDASKRTTNWGPQSRYAAIIPEEQEEEITSTILDKEAGDSFLRHRDEAKDSSRGKGKRLMYKWQPNQKSQLIPMLPYQQCNLTHPE